MSVAERENIEAAARRYNISASEARAIADKVMGVLSRNGWFARGDAEIRHASDWSGEGGTDNR
jgi:hypothetical protein